MPTKVFFDDELDTNTTYLNYMGDWLIAFTPDGIICNHRRFPKSDLSDFTEMFLESLEEQPSIIDWAIRIVKKHEIHQKERTKRAANYKKAKTSSKASK